MIKSAVACLFVLLASQPVLAGDWDGTWSGSWGGKSSATIKIKDDKVVAYYFKGIAQRTGSTSASAKKLSFGSGYRIVLTRSGNSSASAFYRGRGTATADLTRK